MISKEDLTKCHIASGDGLSMATAFVFDSDYTEDEAIAFEYESLAELFGYEECNFVKQKLLWEDDKSYDAITFDKNGSQQTIYFDVTMYFDFDGDEL